MIASPAYSRPENVLPRANQFGGNGFHDVVDDRRDHVVGQPRQRRVGAHAAGVGSGVAVADALEVLRGQQRHHGLAVDDAEQRHLGTVQERLEQHRMPGVEQAGGVRPGGVAVGGHHHALARGQAVVLDHPRRVAARRAEAVERGVEVGGVVDDLAGRGAHARGGHHVLGERLRALDAGGVLRRPEAGDPRAPHGVGDAEHQRHLGPDDHQVGADALGELGDGVAGGDVDVVLVGDDRGAGVAGRDGQLLDLGVSAQRQQQRMFTGTGSDHQDAHKRTP